MLGSWASRAPPPDTSNLLLRVSKTAPLTMLFPIRNNDAGKGKCAGGEDERKEERRKEGRREERKVKE